MEDNELTDLGRQVLVAGHIVIDQVVDRIDQVSPRIALGGPASYSSVALTSLGYSNRVVTKVGADFPAIYERFLERYGGLDIQSAKVENYKTTSYRIDRTFSPRRMWLLQKCKPLAFSDFEGYLRARDSSANSTLVLNPVVGEISLSLLDRISKEFDTVLVDSQGFIRKFSPKTWEVSMKKGLDISSLSGVDILKADREELTSWTAITDLDSSIRELSKFVDTILLTSGPGEVDIYTRAKRILRARPPSIHLADSTGAGDIMLSTFAARYSETGDMKKALSMSVCAASLAVRKLGIEKAILDREEVLQKSDSEVRITEG